MAIIIHNFVHRAAKKLTRSIAYRLPKRVLVLCPRIFPRYRIARHLRSNECSRLHLGAGGNILPGWLNTDGVATSSFSTTVETCRENIFLDVCRRFPIDNSTVSYIFHEHLIEHLSFDNGQIMLKECFRVMKRGGRIRIATPDFDTFVGLSSDDLSDQQRQFIDEYIRLNSSIWSHDLAKVVSNKSVFVINHNFHAWGHQFIYNFATLVDALRQAGFVGTERHTPQRSEDPNLRGLEFRRDIVGIFDALIVEACKP